MDPNGTPHVCFRMTSGLRRVRGSELLKLMKDGLSVQSKFEVKRFIRYFGARSLLVNFRSKRIIVMVGRSKYANDEWIISIASLEGNSLFGDFYINIPELREISACVHQILVSASEIDRIRWYFEGRRSKTCGFSSSDELPWDTWSPD